MSVGRSAVTLALIRPRRQVYACPPRGCDFIPSREPHIRMTRHVRQELLQARDPARASDDPQMQTDRKHPRGMRSFSIEPVEGCRAVAANGGFSLPCALDHSSHDFTLGLAHKPALQKVDKSAILWRHEPATFIGRQNGSSLGRFESRHEGLQSAHGDVFTGS